MWSIKAKKTQDKRSLHFKEAPDVSPGWFTDWEYFIRWGADSHKSRIQKLLKSGNMKLELWARRFLSAHANEADISIISEYLQEPDIKIQLWAWKLYSRLIDKSYVPQIIKYLKNPLCDWLALQCCTQNHFVDDNILKFAREFVRRGEYSARSVLAGLEYLTIYGEEDDRNKWINLLLSGFITEKDSELAFFRLKPYSCSTWLPQIEKYLDHVDFDVQQKAWTAYRILGEPEGCSKVIDLMQNRNLCSDSMVHALKFLLWHGNASLLPQIVPELSSSFQRIREAALEVYARYCSSEQWYDLYFWNRQIAKNAWANFLNVCFLRDFRIETDLGGLPGGIQGGMWGEALGLDQCQTLNPLTQNYKVHRWTNEDERILGHCEKAEGFFISALIHLRYKIVNSTFILKLSPEGEPTALYVGSKHDYLFGGIYQCESFRLKEIMYNPNRRVNLNDLQWRFLKNGELFPDELIAASFVPCFLDD